MRCVTGLYDAPATAAAAIADLRAAGFAASDLLVEPARASRLLMASPAPADQVAAPTAQVAAPADQVAAPSPPRQHPSDAPGGAAERLAAFGLPPQAAEAYAAAVGRGAIVIVVRAPTLSAPVAAAALDVPGVLDLERHAARVQADPNIEYRWSD
ncbi:MAG: hypothetical protein ACK2T6_02610 [Anaerolineae bacterium]|jgi:hypothetical protein